MAPKHEAAVSALERLYVATGQFAPLLAIYDKKLELAKSKSEQLDIRFKLAGLYEDEIKSPDEGRRALPGHPEGATRPRPLRCRPWIGCTRASNAGRIWRRRSIARSSSVASRGWSPSSSSVTAALHEEYLKDPDTAVMSFREALALVPDHAGAREALQVYLKDPERQTAAVEVLEPIYEQTFDLPRLVEVQQIKLAGEKNVGKRVALLLRVGGLQQNLGDPDGAWDAYAQAFAEDPTSADAREALEGLANRLDRWPQLVSLYEAALRKKLSSSLERELLLVVAVAYDEKLGKSEKAVEYFRRAQEIVPEDASALEALERLYTRTERWPDLIDTLRKKADLVSDAGEREAIRVRIATVYEEMLASPDDAISAWREVRAENPENAQALRALDRLYLHRGEFPQLADVIQRQLDVVGDDVAGTVELLGRLGALYELKLGEPGAAVETYRRVLELEPDREETIAALNRILPNTTFEMPVAELLEPVYRRRGDYPNLVAVQEVIARHAATPEQKIAILRQIAEAHELGLDAPDRAYDALSRALAEDPLHPELQSQIERLARALGLLGDLVQRYAALVPNVVDGDLKNALYHKVARLWENDLGRDQEAARAYAAALEVSPRDLTAVNALEQIYLRAGDYAQLVGLLLRKAEIVASSSEKKDLYYKAAQLYEEVLENLDKAVEVYRLVLAVDDTDVVALDNLERLSIRLSRWGDLKDIYAKKADLAQDPGDKKRMLFVLGQVYDRELQDAERAIETYTAILDLDPEDYDAAQALDRLFVQAGRWYDLLSILERQTEMARARQAEVSPDRRPSCRKRSSACGSASASCGAST